MKPSPINSKLSTVFLALALLRGCVPCQAGETMDATKVNRIAVAIFKSEGGYAAAYLYGIKSVPYRTEAEARRICENSIRNNYTRWLASGCTNDFIPFMAARYCPFDQINWTRNVNYFLQPKKP